MKQHHHAIIDAIPAHVAVLGPSGEILEVNQAWRMFASANVLGVESFAVGCNYLDVCEEASGECADEARQAAEGIRQVMRGKIREFTLEYPCHSPSEQRWFQLIATPIQQGAAGGAVIMHVNVTERKALEEALLQREAVQRAVMARLEIETERLNESQKVAKIGSWYTDLVSLEVTWSAETYRIFEADPDAFRPSHQAFLDFVHPADRAAVDEAFRRSLGRSDTFSHGHRIVLPDGRIKFVVERWRNFAGDDGIGPRAVGTCQDVTAARLSEIEFEQVFTYSLDMMCVADLDGRLLQVNPAWTETLGWHSHELIGRYPSDFVMDEDLPSLLSLRRKVMAGKPQRGLLTRCRSKGGSLRWLSWNAHPLIEFQKVFAVARDVTEQITRDQDRYRAQRLESIGTLAGGIAHDLNNTLSPLIMGLDMLTAKVTDPEGRKLITTMSASAQRGAEMVRQVLMFARGEEGRRTTSRVADAIEEVRRFAVDTFDKNIEVLAEVEPGLWNVEGDSTQLHQVLLNLCLNARDAMPRGGRLVLRAVNTIVEEAAAAMHLGAKAGPHVCVQVEDNGVGIARDVMERMFDPFFTTKAMGSGTGLGLSTSLSIVKRSGGFFSVSSQPTLGTMISVCLPASERATTTSSSSELPECPRGSGQMILVVDDEPSVREVTRRVLEGHGYSVMLAADGADAVELYAAWGAEIAAAIVDMVMSGMNGMTAVQSLLRLNPRARIIAVSGYSTGDLLAESLRVGAKASLVKPYTADVLLRTLHQCIHE